MYFIYGLFFNLFKIIVFEIVEMFKKEGKVFD